MTAGLALEADIWPAGARRVDGAVTVGGVDLRDLADEHGTPFYLIDEDDFRKRCRAWQAALPDGDVYYAGKAFLSRAVAGWVAEEGLGLDVCTGGELAVALAAGFPPARMGFHGNNKSPAELAEAVRAGVGRIIVDSYLEIARLAATAERAGIRQPVLVRVTTGVDAHTHEFVATAHEDQKFGFWLADGAAAEAVRRVLMLPSLELVGLHSHIGSQIFDADGFEVSAHRVIALAAAVRAEHQLELPELNLGGGLGIAYLPGDDPVRPAELVRQIRDMVTRECAAAGLTPPRLQLEPGRSICGPSGITVYTVGTVKLLPGLRSYVSVDGGMSDNIRTALYDAEFTAVLASRASAAPLRPTRIVGKHCETGDVVVRNVALPEDIAPGDLLAVAATGAYCRSMSSSYNFVPRPPVLAAAGGRARPLIRRETVDDLLALDVG